MLTSIRNRIFGKARDEEREERIRELQDTLNDLQDELRLYESAPYERLHEMRQREFEAAVEVLISADDVNSTLKAQGICRALQALVYRPGVVRAEISEARKHLDELHADAGLSGENGDADLNGRGR